MHAIRRNHSTSAPSCHVFLDCESSREAMQPADRIYSEGLRLWCATAVRQTKGVISRRKEGYGTTEKEWWDWLSEHISPHHLTWIWAHNLHCDATWSGLYAAIDRGDVEYQYGVHDGPPTIIWTRIRGASVVWVDSLNWFRCPLSELGQAIGLEKLPMPDRDKPDADWYTYCKRDVKILETAVTELISWVRNNEHGQLRTTVASQAWHSWRHQYKGPRVLVHDCPELSDFERKAYYGGRCEVYYQGAVLREGTVPQMPWIGHKRGYPVIRGQSVSVYDIRSAYPAEMARLHYPRRHLYSKGEISIDELWRLVNRRSVIAEVEIETGTADFPVRYRGSTYWPIGKFTTVLATPELRRLCEAAGVKRVKRVEIYESADLFSSWVERLWDLRGKYIASCNKVWAEVVKSMLNSLHGKFGQRASGWEAVHDVAPLKRWGYWIDVSPDWRTHCLTRAIAGKVYQRRPEGEWKDAFVPISAEVSSALRARCSAIMGQFPMQELLYHDTDSFHVLDYGSRFIQDVLYMIGSSLGTLRIVEQVGEAEYFGVKAYRLGNNIRIGGMPRAARPAGELEWVYDEWQPFSSAIDDGPPLTVKIGEGRYHLRANYHRGTVGDDGWVTPLVWPDATELLDALSKRREWNPLDG